MGESRTGIERVVVVGPRWRKRPLWGAMANMPAVEIVQGADPESAGGFVDRRSRGRYLSHVDALRRTATGAAAATVISEGILPPSPVLRELARQLGEAAVAPSILFADPRTGRQRSWASAQLYVVSPEGSRQLLAHLVGALERPSAELLPADFLNSELMRFGLRNEVISV